MMHSVELERVPELGTSYIAIFEGLKKDGFNLYKTEKDNYFYLWRVSPINEGTGFIARVIIVGLVSSKSELMEVYGTVLQEVNDLKSMPPQERSIIVDGAAYLNMNHFWVNTQLSLFGSSELAWDIRPLLVIMDERIVVEIPDEIKEISVLHTNLDEYITREVELESKPIDFKKKWKIWRKSRKLGHYAMFTLPGFGVMTLICTLIPAMASGVAIGLVGIIASMLMLFESLRLYSIFTQELHEQIQYIPSVQRKPAVSSSDSVEVDESYDVLLKMVPEKVSEALKLFEMNEFNKSAIAILDVLENIADKLNPNIKEVEDKIIDGILGIFTSAGMGLDESYESEFIRAVNVLRQSKKTKIFPLELISPYVIIARMLTWLGLIDDTLKQKVFDTVNKPAVESLVADLTQKLKSEEEDLTSLDEKEVGEITTAPIESYEAKHDASIDHDITLSTKDETFSSDETETSESETIEYDDISITDIDAVIEEILGDGKTESTVKEGGH